MSQKSECSVEIYSAVSALLIVPVSMYTEGRDDKSPMKSPRDNSACDTERQRKHSSKVNHRYVPDLDANRQARSCGLISEYGQRAELVQWLESSFPSPVPASHDLKSCHTCSIVNRIRSADY